MHEVSPEGYKRKLATGHLWGGCSIQVFLGKKITINKSSSAVPFSLQQCSKGKPFPNSVRQALFMSSVWGALFLSVFFFVCCAAPFHVTRKDCPTQTLGLLFLVNGVCDTASLLNHISVQQVPTRWIHAFTPLKTKYQMTAKTNGENNICVINKNKTLTHLCHVLPLGNYSHGTLTQHLPEEAGGSCVFPPFHRKGIWRQESNLPQDTQHASNRVRRAYMGPSTLNQSCC